MTGLEGAIGGPQFRVTYPNGDQVGYVSLVYLARVPDGAIATPDGDEVDATRWFSREELTSPVVSDFALHTFRAIGWLNPVAH